MFKKTVLAASVAMLALVPAVHAMDYQGEFGVVLGYLDSDDPDLGTDVLYGADFRYHFDMVPTANVPLAEASFLNRVSSFGVSYVSLDDASLSILDADVQIYHNDLFFSAQVQRLSNGSSLTDYGATIGFFPAESLLLFAGYGRGDGGVDSDFDILSVGAKYVTALEGETALNLLAFYQTRDDAVDSSSLTLAADYYLNHRVSLGARYFHLDDDDVSDSGFGLGTRYFFTPLVSGGLEYEKFDDFESIAAELKVRF
ncbi:putative porin [Isoalcanivorax indicus]|uniref:putative porin n=1 Tax=Isoalcanivorax indicus TaxID=2202653 RepID=UPI0013C44CD8|nr:putative porin [Isoalcanivorax indicus]